MDIKYYRCFQGLWESMNQIWVYDLNIVTLLTDLENVRCLLEHKIILNHDLPNLDIMIFKNIIFANFYNDGLAYSHVSAINYNMLAPNRTILKLEF